MLTALGIVLGGVLIIFYVMRRFLKRDVGGSKEQLIKVISSQYIGIKKNISLVQIPGSILVVGISNDNISLLTKIEDKVVLDRLCQESSRVIPPFAEHLQRLTDRFKRGKNSR
jgi:flagellar protein FliO/FliZ